MSSAIPRAPAPMDLDSCLVDAAGSSVGGAIFDRPREAVSRIELTALRLWRDVLLRDTLHQAFGTARSGIAGHTRRPDSVLSCFGSERSGITMFAIGDLCFNGEGSGVTLYCRPSHPWRAKPEILSPSRTAPHRAVLHMSSADQALELLAALSLNKSQLAEVLGVSRPTLYDWLDGKEPKAANAQRLAALVQILASAGVNPANSLSPRFVRQPLSDRAKSLLDLLKEDPVDEPRVNALIHEAKTLEAEAQARRTAREERLAAAGFEQPTDEQRKANLALNVALREWPKE